MKRMLLAVTIAALLAVLLLPPWRIVWTAPAGMSPGVLPESWAGCHFWSYAAERPEKVIAWDGPGGGGHLTVTGVPAVVRWMWTSLVLALAGIVYVLVRYRVTVPSSSPG